jgi:hypothetical protein
MQAWEVRRESVERITVLPKIVSHPRADSHLIEARKGFSRHPLGLYRFARPRHLSRLYKVAGP